MTDKQTVINAVQAAYVREVTHEFRVYHGKRLKIDPRDDHNEATRASEFLTNLGHIGDTLDRALASIEAVTAGQEKKPDGKVD